MTSPRRPVALATMATILAALSDPRRDGEVDRADAELRRRDYERPRDIAVRSSGRGGVSLPRESYTPAPGPHECSIACACDVPRHCDRPMVYRDAPAAGTYACAKCTAQVPIRDLFEEGTGEHEAALRAVLGDRELARVRGRMDHKLKLQRRAERARRGAR
jgi:hypothetical protein